MVYDLIIVGLGPAGVSAAIYAKRAGLNILCFDKAMVGGYLNYIDKIDNYPGLYGISGPDFAFNLSDTLKKLNVTVENKEVINIKDGDLKEVITSDETYLCKKVIIATGRKHKNLGLHKEEELLGKGISHCALCDGMFYKDKDIAIIGGGASALQEALYLSNICNKVYLIVRKDRFNIEGDLVNKVNEKDNISKIMRVNVTTINEKDGKLESIKLDNEEVLNVSGMFIYIGFEPCTEFANDLGITDETGYILVNNSFESNVKGIYAVGDIIKKEIYQISTAVSDGVVAATNVINDILSK